MPANNALQDPHSPLIRSDVAFQLYCTSLVNNGFESSIIPAVRRRESLLASAPPQSPPNTTAESSPVVNPVAAPTALPTSRSQEIAQDVLSGNSATSLFSSAQAGGKASPDMAQLATALGGGAGNAGNPIFVTVSDRESIMLILQDEQHAEQFHSQRSYCFPNR